MKSTVFRTQYTIFSYLIHILLDRFLEADWRDKAVFQNATYNLTSG